MLLCPGVTNVPLLLRVDDSARFSIFLKVLCKSLVLSWNNTPSAQWLCMRLPFVLGPVQLCASTSVHYSKRKRFFLPHSFHFSAVFSSVCCPIIYVAHLSAQLTPGFFLSPLSPIATTSLVSVPLFRPTHSDFFPLGQLQTPRLGFTPRPPPSARSLFCHPFLASSFLPSPSSTFSHSLPVSAPLTTPVHPLTIAKRISFDTKTKARVNMWFLGKSCCNMKY